MIIQPDFPEHFKTRLLVEITGDESAPMAVIRLWAYCQCSKRDSFPNMTPAQLASICRWGERKPPCHIALVKAGFVEKLSPKGFAAHQWSEYNRQLTQKWEAGQKGGRPPASEKPNKDRQSVKPTDNRPVSDRQPTDNRPITDRQPTGNLIDQTRPDGLEKTRPDQTRLTGLDALGNSVASVSSEHGGMDSFSVAGGDGGLDGLAKSIVRKMGTGLKLPTLAEVESYLSQWPWAKQYAPACHKTMVNQGWRDNKGILINDWKSFCKKYADACEEKRRKGR